MDQDEYNDFVRRKPFRAYRMTLSDGQTYDIGQPELAAVGFGSVIVAVSPGREVLVSLMHVVRIEFLDAEVVVKPKDANGTT